MRLHALSLSEGRVSGQGVRAQLELLVKCRSLPRLNTTYTTGRLANGAVGGAAKETCNLMPRVVCWLFSALYTFPTSPCRTRRRNQTTYGHRELVGGHLLS